MATEQPKAAAEDVKMDLFEDDDEFEEFEIDQGQSTRFLNFLLLIIAENSKLRCSNVYVNMFYVITPY